MITPRDGLRAVVNYNIIIVIIICLFMITIIMHSVAAQTNQTIAYYEGRYNVSITVDERFGTYAGYISGPYVGGYEANPYNGRKASTLQATFSFPDTSREAIPSGKYLELWLESTVMTSIDRIDYGYRIGVEFNREYTIVWSEVWKFCEGLRPECWTPRAWLLHGHGVVINANPSDKITVRMRWEGDYVRFYYSINSGSFVKFSEFKKAPESQNAFSLGYYVVWGVPAKYLQFALFSPSSIGGGGWKALIEYPRYVNSTGSYLINYARSVQGPNSWLDAVWRWGSDTYANVNAYYDRNSSIGKYKILFYWTTSTLSDDTILWQ